MNISFNGIGEQVVTFLSANTTKGIPVKVSANETVAACASGDSFAGVVISAGNGLNAVQTHGYVKLGYTGSTAPTVGYCTLAGNGSGGVAVPASGGRSYLVVDVDTTGKTVGFML